VDLWFGAGRLRSAILAAAVVVLAAMAGCAAPQASALRAALGTERLADLPRHVALDAVDFHAQLDFHCGPASLAMAMSATGLRVDPQALAATVFVPGREGAFQAEMLAAARRQGLLATELPPRLESLLREVAAGRPVIVLQNLALPISPLWHYAVVVGYDLDRRQVLLHSGQTPRMPMSIDTFEHTWARSGHWSMAITEPTVLPLTVTERQAGVAAVALERIDRRTAGIAYDTVLARWPENRVALLGRGNVRHAAGDVAGAVEALRDAVERDPDFAEAWHNLAVALGTKGERQQARQAADRAVALGGPRAEAFAATRAKLDD
jgi:tetratricopeptide (TPR) repeat protein